MRGRLARRMIAWTILFSGLIALLITVAQLLIEYRRDVQTIDDRFVLIEQSYLPSIIDSVWVADRDRMTTLLSGIVRLPDFSLAEVGHKGTTLARVGEGRGLNPGEILVRRWPLKYSYRDEERLIGELEIVADLGSARARIFDRAGFVISTNFLKTILVAFFLFLMVQYQMTRHLEKISSYAGSLRPENLDVPLVLERSPNQKPDELSDLVASINQTREQLRVAYLQMLELNQTLEKRVQERTAELSLEVGMRRQNEMALLRSESQLRAVLDVALIGIIVIDERGIVQVINPAARELFGYSGEEILGRNVKVLMPHEYSQYHDGYLQRYRGSGSRNVIGAQRNVTGLRKDGSEFPMRLALRVCSQSSE